MEPINLLLIDDDDQTRLRLAAYLQQTVPCQVQHFGDGFDALEHLAQNPDRYQVVLSDWVLNPPLDGSVLLERVKRINRHLPVIVFSGNADAGAEAYHKGAYAYFPTSGDIDQMVEAVEDIARQDNLLRTIATTAQAVMHSDQVLVWQLRRSTQELVLKARANPAALARSELEQTVSLDNKQLKKILAQDGPQFLSSEKLAGRYHSLALAEQHAWTSIILTPLVYNGEVLGLLESCYCDRWSFPDDRQPAVSQMLRAYVEQAAETIFTAEQVRKNHQIILLNSLLAEYDTLEAVARAITGKGLELLGAQAGWVYLTEHEHQRLEPIAYQGDGIKPAHVKPIPVGQTLAGAAVRAGKILTIKDTRLKSNKYPPVPAPSAILSQVAIPLYRSKSVRGVLVFGSSHANAFSESDHNLFYALATMVGPLLNQTQLRTYLENISQAMLQGEQAVRKNILHAIYELTGKPVALWLADPDNSSRIKLSGCLGMSPEFKKKRFQDVFLTAAEETPITQAIKTKQRVYCKDLYDQKAVPRFRDVESARHEGWESAQFFPLFDSEERPLGTINLYDKKVREIEPEEQNFLHVFFTQASIALENEHRRAGLGKLLESGQTAIPGVQNVQAALKKFARTACELIGAHAAVIYPYDQVVQTFYDVDKIAYYRIKRKKSEYRPRKKGLAQVLRFTNNLVVHDVALGKIEPVDLSRVEQLESTGSEPMTMKRLREIILEESFIHEENIKAFMGVSLRTPEESRLPGGDVDELGVLYVNFLTPHQFTHSEINLIKLLAQQAANLIRTSHLWNNQQTLVQANQALAHAQDVDDVLRITFREAHKFVGHSTGLILAVEKDHRLRLVDSEGLTAQHIRTFNDRPVCDEEGTFGLVIRTGEVFESLDARNDPRVAQLGLPVPQQLINLPVKSAGAVAAILVLDTAVTNQHTRQTLVALADMAGTALEKAISYNERSEQLDALQHIIDVLGTDQNTLGVILEQAVCLFAADYGLIGLSIEAARQLDFQALWEDGQLFIGEQIPDNNRCISFDDGITGYVAREKQPFLHGDVRTVEFYLPYNPDTRSEMTVPMVDSNGRLIGVLDLEGKRLDAFSENDLALCRRLARIAAIAIEKSDLLRTTQSLHEEIDGLQKIITEADLDKALEHVVKGVMNILGPESCSASINLYNERAERFFPTLVAQGELKELINVAPRPDGLGQYVLKHGHSIYYEDVDHIPADTPRVNPSLLNAGVRSFAALPLLRGRHRLGALFIHQQTPAAFSQDLRAILEFYARQAAVAIDDAQRGWIGDALRLIQDASAKNTTQEFMDLVVSQALRLMQAKGGELWLKNSDGSLVLQSLSGWLVTDLPEENRIIPPGADNLIMEVLQTGRPQVMEIDPQKDRLFAYHPQAKYYLVMPLIYQNEVLSVLVLKSDQKEAFDEHDIPRLDRFASPTAIAIHNAWLMKQQQEQKQQSDTLRKIAQELNATSEINLVIQLVLERLRDVVEYSSASVQLIQGDRRDVREVSGPYKKYAQAGYLHRPLSEDRLVSRIIAQGEPAVLRYVTDDADWEIIEATQHIGSWMGIPMVVNQQCIGLLTVDHEKPGFYTQAAADLAAVFANLAAAAIYRSMQAQALMEVHQLTEELLKLDETTPRKKLLQLIADKACTVLRADIIRLYEYVEATKTADPNIYTGGELLHPYESDQVRADDAVYQLINNQQPRYIVGQDLELSTPPLTGDRSGLPEGRFTVREKIKANAAVPLRAGSETVGILFVNYRSIQNFDQEQRNLIELFASQAAVAIQNARQYQEKVENIQFLDRLNRIGRQVNATRDLNKVLDILLTEALALTGGVGASVWLLNPTTQTLVCEEVNGRAEEELLGYQMPLDQGIVGWTARHGKSEYVPDILLDARHARRVDQHIGAELHSLLSIPLMRGSRVSGVLQVVAELPDSFTLLDLNRLELLAEFAAAAIENARLFKVNEIGQALNAVIEKGEREILEVIHKRASEFMDTNNIFIALYDEKKDEVSFGLAYVDGKMIDLATARDWQPRRGGVGRTEEVIKLGEPILTETLAEAQEWYNQPGRTNYIKTTFASWVGIPMKVGSNVLGVIAAFHKTEEYKYDDLDIEALKRISQNLAVALFMFRQIRRKETLMNQNEALRDLGVDFSRIIGSMQADN